MNSINIVYKKLLNFHGHQGWWPIVNPDTNSSEYHLNAPRNEFDQFEIAIGAILTQNIAWKNVVKAIIELKRKKKLSPNALSKITPEKLAILIKPTGYYNQKAKKIKNFLNWHLESDFKSGYLLNRDLDEIRNELLEINGIGPETADSILLYAFSKKIFVIDAYTSRIFSRLGILSGNEKYHEIQKIFHKNFKGNIKEYNEYHALIVSHGKNICKKKPDCAGCCLSDICRSNR